LRKNYSHLRAGNFHGGINGSISDKQPAILFPLVGNRLSGLRFASVEDPTARRQL
jgi:hypothetical protein